MMRWTFRLMVMVLVLLGALAPASAKDLAAMSTDEIRGLQQRLADAKCYTGPIDGQPSPATEQARGLCPDQEPILSIETGSHRSPVNGITSTADCDSIITGSFDKTIRIWSSRTGNLMRTIRLPVGYAGSGSVYQLAVSHNDRYLAVSGAPAKAYKGDRTAGIYIIDLKTDLVRMIGSFQVPSFSVDFSWDDSKVAVGLGQGGVRVLDISSGNEVGRAEYKNGGIYSLKYKKNGSLLVMNEVGEVDLYDDTMNLIAKNKDLFGVGGHGFALNEKKSTIAVGVPSTGSIYLFDANTLKVNAVLDENDKEDHVGAFNELAWSENGRFLFASGAPQKIFAARISHFIRKIDMDSNNRSEDYETDDGANYHIKECAGSIFWSDESGRVGSYLDNQVSRRISDDSVVDFRDQDDGNFLLSADGMVVAYRSSHKKSGDFIFDYKKNMLSPWSSNNGLIDPDTKSIPVKGWMGEEKPSVYGHYLSIPDNDTSRSLAILRDGSGFFLGTENYLIFFDKYGGRLWGNPTATTIWGLNVSSDKKFVVAALGDGTIRWYRAKDGVELLSLFVEKRTRKWVAWTPTGYYMASPGGEDLIGWHVNRGWDQEADFFPASRFRDQFNRPDVVQKVLTTLDEDQAVAEANAEAHRDSNDAKPIEAQLPPVIRITSPREDSAASGSAVTLDYTLRSPSGLPVDTIDVMIDGRPVSKSRGVERVDEASQAACPGLVTRGVTRNEPSNPTEEVVCHITVPLSAPSQTFEIGLIARSGNLASVPALVRLTFSSGTGPSEARKPKLYVLSIGVSDYADPKLKLGFPAKDAEDFAKVMTGQTGGLYDGVEEKILTNGEASRANVLKGLDWLSQTVTSHDVAMVFMAGHGVTEGSGSFYYLPSDASAEEQHLGGVSQDDIKRMLAALPSKVLFFLDACHSGQAASELDRRSTIDVNSLVNDLSASENGIVSFASSTGRELSEESSSWGHGAFTVALIEGIGEGKAGLLKNGTITLSELDAYVANRVTTLTSGRQHPVMNKPATITNFPIAEVSAATPAVLTTRTEVSQERPVAPAAQPPAPISVSDDTDAKADFMITKDINTIGGWSTFLKKYPSGFYSDLAREAKSKLEAQGSPPQPSTAGNSGSNVPVTASSAAAQPVTVNDCDRLAASPDDPSRPEGVAGLELRELKPEAVDACRTAVSQYPDEVRFQYELGRSLTKQKQFEEAMSWFQKGADKNFAPSQSAIGILYDAGYGVPQDYKQAMQWYLKAADHGNAEAEYNICTLYSEGQGVAKDATKAVKWCLKAADHGDAAAQYALGLFYDDGEGVPKDKKKAVQWYTKAANKGNTWAQNNLANHYDDGVGVPQDFQKAVYWYSKAAENGLITAQQNMAAMYDNGRGVERDPQKAAELLLDAIKKGSGSAAEQLVDNTSAWKVETRKAVQQILSDQGRYTGRVDGTFGRGTLIAIVQLYQESQQNK